MNKLHKDTIEMLLEELPSLRKTGFRKAVLEAVVTPWVRSDAFGYVDEDTTQEDLDRGRQSEIEVWRGMINITPDAYLIDRERQVIECVEVVAGNPEAEEKYVRLAWWLDDLYWDLYIHVVHAKTGGWLEIKGIDYAIDDSINHGLGR